MPSVEVKPVNETLDAAVVRSPDMCPHADVVDRATGKEDQQSPGYRPADGPAIDRHPRHQGQNGRQIHKVEEPGLDGSEERCVDQCQCATDGDGTQDLEVSAVRAQQGDGGEHPQAAGEIAEAVGRQLLQQGMHKRGMAALAVSSNPPNS